MITAVALSKAPGFRRRRADNGAVRYLFVVVVTALMDSDHCFLQRYDHFKHKRFDNNGLPHVPRRHEYQLFENRTICLRLTFTVPGIHASGIFSGNGRSLSFSSSHSSLTVFPQRFLSWHPARTIPTDTCSTRQSRHYGHRNQAIASHVSDEISTAFFLSFAWRAVVSFKQEMGPE